MKEKRAEMNMMQLTFDIGIIIDSDGRSYKILSNKGVVYIFHLF